MIHKTKKKPKGITLEAKKIGVSEALLTGITMLTESYTTKEEPTMKYSEKELRTVNYEDIKILENWWDGDIHDTADLIHKMGALPLTKGIQYNRFFEDDERLGKKSLPSGFPLMPTKILKGKRLGPLVRFRVLRTNYHMDTLEQAKDSRRRTLVIDVPISQIDSMTDNSRVFMQSLLSQIDVSYSETAISLDMDEEKEEDVYSDVPQWGAFG
jgi:hypothetical protein